jgi:hypothetical protein
MTSVQTGPRAGLEVGRPEPDDVAACPLELGHDVLDRRSRHSDQPA